MRPRRVAVVGTGIGAAHLEALAALPEMWQITAVVDPDAARAAQVAARFGAVRSFTGLDALLDAGVADVVDLCTPPAMHRAQLLAVLGAGCHVICEKPLVESLAALESVAAAAATAGRVVMPVFQYRFDSGMARARAVHAAGLLGGHRLTTVETFWRRGADYYATPWRGRRATELGGVMLCHAVHAHDLAALLWPQVSRVFARHATLVNRIETEDVAVASLQLADGSLASLSATLGSATQLTRLRMHFEHATLESSTTPYAPGREPWLVRALDAGRQGELERVWNSVRDAGFGARTGFQAQFAGLAEALQSGCAPPVTLDDARRSLQLASAIYISAASGRDVALPIRPGQPGWNGWLDG